MAQARRKDEQPFDLKHEAHRLVDILPEKATWRDLIYAIHVRLSIEQGMKDSRAGRVVSQKEVERMFGIRK